MAVRKLPRSPATPPKRPKRPGTPYGAPASLYSAPTTASRPHRKIPTSDPGGGKVWSNRGIITFGPPGRRLHRKIPTSYQGPGKVWSNKGVITLAPGEPVTIKPSYFQGGHRGPPAFFKRAKRRK